MGSFDFYMPVKIFSGIGALNAHKAEFQRGKRCLIVTGRHSAIESGALSDVTELLDGFDISYTIFDKISANPLLSVCDEGGKLARDCDFVVGIGGGSAVDAAKAIAAYGANPEISGDALFTKAVNPSLPLIAVPTTSGTGSEVNNYAIMSLDGQNKKKTFKNAYSHPVAAFLDPRYTYSLGLGQTISTALDAFAHAMESYMSPKSTDISRGASVYAAKLIWSVIKDEHTEFSASEREALQKAACAAGIAINSTGTGFPHPLGYNLTMFHGIPHGAACAVFEWSFIKYTEKSEVGRVLTKRFADECGFALDVVCERLHSLSGVTYKPDENEIQLFVNTTSSAGNYANNPYVIGIDEMKQIYRDM